MRVCAGKNRIVQVAKSGDRKLFGKARKEAFLEWFAATCNVRLSACKAGVHEKTVYKHLLKDAAFDEAFGRALQLGYARLEARLLQEAAPGSSTIDSSADGLPSRSGQDYEVRVGLGEAEVEETFDPQLALHLLREHGRRLSGPGGKRKNLRTTALTATNAEVIAALTKRLKAFALRQGSEQAMRASKKG